MAAGKLKLEISDVLGQPIGGEIELKLQPLDAGGEAVAFRLNGGNGSSFTLKDIECLDGPSTRYQVFIDADHYRSYSFFQAMRANRINAASDRVRLLVNPKRVKGIAAPTFAALPKAGRDLLINANMLAAEPGDEDLAGLSGEGLYQALGPLRQAAFLNILKKAGHRATSENCLRCVQGLLIVRQDRLFATVDPKLLDLLQKSPLYKSAPNTLHTPPQGCTLIDSFKTKDAHANLQVTLHRSGNGEMSADIDIDEAGGFEHGLEVLRNSLFRQRTRPYLIRELLILADPEELTLDPGYRFTF